jgi:hypothetical protein
MISSRGPKGTLVLDRNCVPVRDVIADLLTRERLSGIREKYLISDEEIFDCIDIFIDNFGPTEHDFIKLVCNRIESDISVEAVGLSDWVFVSAIAMGRTIGQDEDRIRTLFAYGLEVVMIDCLTDLKSGKDYYLYSELHTLVLDAFEDAFGQPLTQEDIDVLLGTLYNTSKHGAPDR